jgi:tetratricopeptide (TPR) repeat protein
MELGAKQGDATPIMDEADALWAQRGDRAQAEAAIAKWEEAAKVDPTHGDVHLKLSYGYYFLANNHARWDEDNNDAMAKLFHKGKEAGERAILIQSPEFKKALETQKWEEAVKLVPKEGIASLYWYATNLGKWGLTQGITTVLGNKNNINATMKRVLSLDETFFHGAPHRFFGVYEAKVPFGDINRSGESFDQSIKISPNYLDTKVLKAQYFAAKTQNEELFTQLLNEVIAADPKAIPELEIENRNAQRTAKDLLENIEDYF